MNSILKYSFKNFSSAKAKISFLGKRSSITSQGHHKQSQHTQHHIKSQEAPQTNKKQQSQQIEKPKFSFHYRPTVTAEEIEAINNGGDIKLPDWNKIKIKAKKI
jgi:guanyl-specific ribonuclease Sa